MKNNWKRRSSEFKKRVLLNKANKRWRAAHRKKSGHRITPATEEQIMIHALKRAFPGYEYIPAPRVFSLANNEVETLSFLRAIKDLYDTKSKLVVRLDGVKKITSDAILLLMYTMVQFKTANIKFNGTKPKNKYVRQKVEKSGFFDYLLGQGLELQEEYSFNKIESHLYTHGQKRVDAALADALVKSASTFVWGEPRRCQGVQKTLLELMHNTYDHADRIKGEKHWWLSVDQDKNKQEVTFAFVDFGVGIFRSLRNKKPTEPLYGALDRLIEKFPGVKTEPELLKLILEGHIRRTQSKKYNRGKGLSKINTLYKENKISSLVMMSNYASIRKDEDDFHKLDDEFMGTFISFKINKNTVSLPWIG